MVVCLDLEQCPGAEYGVKTAAAIDLNQLIHSQKFNLFGERPTISGIFQLAAHDIVRLRGEKPEN
jgi:hypothetical protein